MTNNKPVPKWAMAVALVLMFITFLFFMAIVLGLLVAIQWLLGQVK